MSGEGSSKEKNLEWMYEGPKSSINREDYLLGKKVDKNFELFSDVVVRDKTEEEKDGLFRKSASRSASSGQKASIIKDKTTVLELSTVRTEDPLVALKMREEHRKREMLENPLLKAKMQRALREAYEKEIRHEKKSKKKKHKKHDRSQSPKSNSPKHKRKDVVVRDKTEEEKDGLFRKSASRSASSGQKASIIKDKTTVLELSTVRTEDPLVASKRKHSSHDRDRKSEQMEAKRREMMENAQWRDKARDENIQRAAEKLRQEEEEQEKATGTSFLRPLRDLAAGSSSSMEKRLQTNKKNLQRSHDHMEKSFTRK
ncbi:pre-mRNA splicing factor domain-containing protein [Ditylenchus destructor]|nr:pre-mRNA splicing factor domain-containing protein [Ditylenchus destructor]